MKPLALAKFVGSKRWLVSGYPHFLPLPRRGRYNRMGRAFDLFCGGGSVAFCYLAQGYETVIGDTNARLIGCLRNLKERPDAVIGTLEAEASAYRDAENPRADFYSRRSALNRLDAESLESAALFLFTLRAGFNGLWRENADGECNTTWGDPAPGKDLVRADELQAIAALLQKADIRHGDYRDTGRDIQPWDSVFLDSPYANEVPSGKAFVGYSKGGWTLNNRLELAMWVRWLDQRGARWTLTDARTNHSLAAYGLWNTQEVDVRRSVSCKAESRKPAVELIARNWYDAKAEAA